MAVVANRLALSQSEKIWFLGKGFWNRIQMARELSHQRSSLKPLLNDTLKGICLTRVDANFKANHPFWDVPRNWRC